MARRLTAVGVAMTVGAAVAVVTPVRPIVVRGDSMSPAYADGEVLASVPVGRVEPGDVVVLEHAGQTYVKRIVLMEGERYRRIIRRNGYIDLVQIDPEMVHGRAPTEDVIVPPGHVYVLGDHLTGSVDSRDFGCVPLGSLRRKIADRRPLGYEIAKPYTTLRRYADPRKEIAQVAIR